MKGEKKKKNESKIPVIVLLVFVALAVFTTKDVVLDVIYFILGVIGFFIAKKIVNKKK